MKSLFKQTLLGFLFVSIFGTLFHFAYHWSGNALIVGLFCPINESIWEHIKLLFFPYLIWSVIEYFSLSKHKGILPSKAIGAFVGMVFLPLFYYAYTGLFGKNIDIVNIISFFIGVLLSFAVDYILIKSGKLEKKSNAAAIIFFIAATLLFILFTFAPPFLPLFRDPISFTYGI